MCYELKAYLRWKVFWGRSEYPRARMHAVENHCPWKSGWLPSTAPYWAGEMGVIQPLLECLQRWEALSLCPAASNLQAVCRNLLVSLTDFYSPFCREHPGYFSFGEPPLLEFQSLWFGQDLAQLSVLVVGKWSKPGESSCFTLWP